MPADSRSVAPADPPPVLDQIEAVRLRLTFALTEGTANGVDPDTWEQAVLSLGQATRNRLPGELLIGLAADLTELEVAIRRCRSARALRRLIRVAANMSGLMCLLYVKLDDCNEIGDIMSEVVAYGTAVSVEPASRRGCSRPRRAPMKATR